MSTPTPAPPSIQPFLDHPDFTAVTSFVAGLVALLSLGFLIAAANTPWRIWGRVQERVAAVLRDPESTEGTGVQAWEGKVEKEQEGEEEDRSRQGTMVPVLASNKESKLERLIKAGSRSLSLGIDTAVLVSSLSRFGTMLVFFSVNATGCAFLAAWAVLGAELVRPLGFLHLILSDLRAREIAGAIELWIIYSFCGLRIILAVVSTAVNPGGLSPLPTPFSQDIAICVQWNNLAVGATTSSVDLVFSIYLFLRIFLFDLSEEEMGTLMHRFRWRRVVRRLLKRRYAKMGSLALLVVSAFAGELGATNVAGTFVPESLSLLVVLYAFNSPRLQSPLSPSGRNTPSHLPPFSTSMDSQSETGTLPITNPRPRPPASSNPNRDSTPESLLNSNEPGLSSQLRRSDRQLRRSHHSHKDSAERRSQFLATKGLPQRPLPVAAMSGLPPPPSFAAATMSRSSVHGRMGSEDSLVFGEKKRYLDGHSEEMGELNSAMLRSWEDTMNAFGVEEEAKIEVAKIMVPGEESSTRQVQGEGIAPALPAKPTGVPSYYFGTSGAPNLDVPRSATSSSTLANLGDNFGRIGLPVRPAGAMRMRDGESAPEFDLVSENGVVVPVDARTVMRPGVTNAFPVSRSKLAVRTDIEVTIKKPIVLVQEEEEQA